MSNQNALGKHPEPGERFDALFAAHHNQIYRYCVRRLGRFDAEDAAAEVFAVVWRRLSEMPEGESRRAWLFAVAYRVVGNQYRSRRRRASLTTRVKAMSPPDQAQASSDPDDGVEIDAVRHALNRLNEKDAELLRLSSWDGLSRSEIAQVLGIKENAVDQRLHRARNRLRARIEDLTTTPSSTEHEEASA